MSTQFGGETLGGAGARDETSQEAAATYQTDDLRNLIERIAEQMADADQRQSAALAQMLSRVEMLAAEARSQKANVPAEFLPAFERIEDGVSLLAERIARAHMAHADGSQLDVDVCGNGACEPAPKHCNAVQPAATSTSAAHETEVAVAQEPPREAAAAAIDPVMANDEDAWDQSAVDALAAHYEEQLGNPLDFIGEYDGRADDAAGIEAEATRAADHVATAAFLPGDIKAALQDDEKSWLEDRFFEIARRLEDGLAQVDTKSPLSLLDARFDQLEQNFGSAMTDVATRRDVEALHVLEGHIAELTQQFEETRGQLDRLDGIEHSLAAVIDRLSDPRFDLALERTGTDERDLEHLISSAVEQISERVYGNQAPAPDVHSLAEGIAKRLHTSQPQLPDLRDLADGIAEAAAQRVASRLADFAPRQEEGNGEDVSAIRHLLDQFITERREGEEQTAAMLDTMQRAIIRVLDRVDALEMSHPKPGAADHARYGADPIARTVESAPLQPKATKASGDAGPGRPTPYDAAEREPAQRAFAEPPHHAKVVPQPASPPQQQPPHLPGSQASIERLRQDFIADARRAKERASAATTPAAAGAAAVAAGAMRAAMAHAEPEAETPAAIGVKLAKPRTSEAAEEISTGSSVLSRFRKPSRKLLVSAIVLMIAIPGVIMLLKKGRVGASIPTAIEQAEKPAAREISPVAPAVAGAVQESVTTFVPTSTRPDAEDPKAAGMMSRPDKLPMSERGQFGGTMQKDGAVAAPQDASTQVGAARGDETAPATVRPSAGGSSGILPGNPQTQMPRPFNGSQDGRAAPANVMPIVPVSPISSASPPAGITVAHPRNRPTLEQLQTLGERQAQAQLSSQLGEAQVNAIPAALIPEFMQGQNTGPAVPETPAVSASLSDSHRRPIDLPPATVGPLSLRMAAAKGDPSAEFAVAARFADGTGVQQDLGEAMRWYQRSAARGFAQSQYRVATFYERGLGVKSDMARAKVWYQRAAEGGNIKSMHNLAVLSAGKAAKVPDYAGAARWFKAAADHGLADSQFNLAVLHESGLGVAKEAKEAYFWYALAARGGDAEAARRQQATKQAMSAADITATEQRIAAWRPKAGDRVANDPLTASEAWKARATAEGAI